MYFVGVQSKYKSATKFYQNISTENLTEQKGVEKQSLDKLLSQDLGVCIKIWNAIELVCFLNTKFNKPVQSYQNFNNAASKIEKPTRLLQFVTFVHS